MEVKCETVRVMLPRTKPESGLRGRERVTMADAGRPRASSTYYDYKRREPSNRTLRDEKLKVLITETYEANYSVYGAKKLWAALNRAGNEVARCTVERLMRELGIKGAIRGKGIVITTIADESLERPKDLIKRHFVSWEPNELWCADITYVKTRAGWTCCTMR